ncbi:amidohydrolase family protein [Flavihumibacter fluvii]|uniref:amidohydrolase family protein n=1 Tax=Flavihumibacter fluvii TaxID=2838157 RepID=UPI001BDE7AB1|nr:amidohydrolase family protein [Flavihumibacter fluvii]ULQ54076.1 amidohydrolase [Flavihumibacter fluvii]
MKRLEFHFGLYYLLGFVLLIGSNAFAQKKKVQKLPAAAPPSVNYELNDSHFHLTNYIQEGTNINKFLEIMGNKVGRVALFGIPLQQQWSYGNTGNFAPSYYLASDAPLYYYSFTDAFIAMAYKSLRPDQQQRFDPMITGFNPADMYAADHIKRVLKVFPNVFSGIGEFSIHKEFVSSKVSGETASLNNPALDKILDFAAEAGLVVILHNDIDMPYPKSGQEPYLVKQLGDLFRRHKETTIIWAHCGLGRVVQPIHDQLRLLEVALGNPETKHVYIDLSWDEVAKYIVASPEAIKATAAVINKYPDRFLFGTDEVAPSSQEKYLKIYNMYSPLFDQLTPEARSKLLKGNYERLFDAARIKVRAWEKAHANDPDVIPQPTPSSGVAVPEQNNR